MLRGFKLTDLRSKLRAEESGVFLLGSGAAPV
jgi:hypothetical protein